MLRIYVITVELTSDDPIDSRDIKDALTEWSVRTDHGGIGMTIIEHTITRPLIIPSATSMDWTDIDSIGHDLLALTYQLVDDPFGTLLALSSNGVVKVISGCRHIGNDEIAESLLKMQAHFGETAICAGMWVSRDDDDHHHVHGDPMASRYRMLFVVGTDPRNIHAFTTSRTP